MKATTTIYRGIIDTEYTGQMLFNLDSGKTLSYAVKGLYSGVSVTASRSSLGRLLS